MDHLKNRLSFRKVLVFQIDSVLIIGSIYLALSFRPASQFPADWLIFLEKAVFVTLLCQAIFYINDLYDIEEASRLSGILKRILLAFAVSSMVLGVLYLFFPGLKLSQGIFLSSMLISLVLICFWRILFSWIIVPLHPRQNVFILGTGRMARVIAQELLKRPNSRYHLKGILDFDTGYLGKRRVMGLNTWNIEDKFTKQSIANKKIDKLIVAVSQRRETLPIEFLLDCKIRGVEVIDTPNFYERLTGKILIEELRPSWFIFSSGFKRKYLYQVAKQVLDIIFALVGLVIASPIMLLIAAFIKLDSPGPVLFRQERAAKNGCPFTILKFRSMYLGAEEETGPVWAAENDQRITRVGRIIRRMRLDELPQMINVLKGDLSFVGPRPERPFFIEKLQEVIPYYNQRLVVKPGITGWAAVNYQYSSSVESAIEKLQYDLYYIKNKSFVLDMQVILKTFQVMLTGRGSK